ncbi:MAG: MATE family efflux transporter [Anaerovoracaceae bacterium]
MDTNNSSITSFNKITEGVIWKEMIKYCIPIAVGTLFQQLYNVVDAIVVGRAIGTEALAAVGGSASILSMVIVAFFSGLTAGASVIIAQHYGAKEGRKVDEAMHTAFAFAISAGLIMGVAGCLGTEWLLELMKTPEETMDLSVSYLRIYFVGLVATLTFNMGASVMRSIGDSKRPLYYLIVCSILNIVLDIVFVVFLGWGIIGAAAATVAAQAVSCIMTMYSLMHSYDEVKLVLKKIRIMPHVLWRELRIGIPGGLQSCISGITNIMIQTAINTFGTNVTAGWAAYNKIDMVYWMVLSSFGAAATTFVGQNYGANRMDRVKKTAWTSFMLSSVTCSVILAVLVALAEPLMSIFTTNIDVVKTGAAMLYFMIPMYIVAIFMEIPTDVLRGLGYTFWPMTFALTTMVGLRIPWLLFVVPAHHTVNNVLLSYPIAIGSAAILINVYFFIVMRRLRKKS